MTYQVNVENTGLRTHEQAEEVARILASKGYDVEFTRNCGRLPDSGCFPCTYSDWGDALNAAKAAFPA